MGQQINFGYIETDDENNIYVAFKHQNRIEKYNSDGILLLSIDRILEYPVEHTVIEREWRSGPATRVIPEYAGTYVSQRTGVDSEKRIWVVKHIEQPKYGKDQLIENLGKRVFEVYDSNGVLLTQVPHPNEGLMFLKMEGDVLLFTDKEYITITKYQIKEL